jgi:cytochrome P450/NADPH-cytochrome P450 reductase
MIAAGTGIAPFRGFIQERTAQLVCGREVGPTILYYGCRTENDFLYANEFNRWSKFDAIQIKTTFSRQSDENKKYVQHLIWEDRLEIARLYRQGARFYTCGSATKIAASVKTCFIKIIADDQQCDEEKAAKILENISIDRYNVDVFA